MIGYVKSYHAALLAAALAAASISGCGVETKGVGVNKSTFLASDITGAAFGRDFNLNDHTGKTRTLADFKGKVVVVFFGYINCPDVCPATLGELSEAMKKLGKDAERVQVLFVTIDPERDTPERLGKYLSSFNSSFLGLTGDDQSIKKVTEEFKVAYRQQAGGTAEQHDMDHSIGTYIFDAAGKLRLYVSNGNGSEVFPHDIAALLKGR